MTKLIRNAISVRSSLIHGRGVFADKDIPEGDIIEESPVLSIPEKSGLFINYAFKIPKMEKTEHDKKDVVALGYGSIYNHSSEPNAEATFDSDNLIMRFTAKAPIHRDNEIFISYGKSWFQDRGLIPLQVSFKHKARLFIRKHRPIFRAMLLTTNIFCLLTLLKMH